MNNLEQGNVYQMGGAFLTGTGAFTPPTGKVVVAIQAFANLTFTTLTPANDAGSNTYHIGTTVASITNNNNNITVEGNGTNASAIGSNQIDKNNWLYGKWSAVELASGKAILYFGQA